MCHSLQRVTFGGERWSRFGKSGQSKWLKPTENSPVSGLKPTWTVCSKLCGSEISRGAFPFPAKKKIDNPSGHTDRLSRETQIRAWTSEHSHSPSFFPPKEKILLFFLSLSLSWSGTAGRVFPAFDWPRVGGSGRSDIGEENRRTATLTARAKNLSGDRRNRSLANERPTQRSTTHLTSVGNARATTSCCWGQSRTCSPFRNLTNGSSLMPDKERRDEVPEQDTAKSSVDVDKDQSRAHRLGNFASQFGVDDSTIDIVFEAVRSRLAEWRPCEPYLA